MPAEDATTVDHAQSSPGSHEGDGHDLDVVAIGSPLLDVIELASDEQLAQVGLEKGSMTLIDLVTANAVQEFMGAPRYVSGGSVANTTAGIAVLGGHGRLRGSGGRRRGGPDLHREPAGRRRRVRAALQRVGRRRRARHGALRGPDHRGRGPDHGDVPGGGVHAVARGRPDVLRGPGLRGAPRGLPLGRPGGQGGHAPRRGHRPRLGGLGGAVPLRPLLRESTPARVPRTAHRRRRHPAGQRGGGHHALRRLLARGGRRGRRGDRLCWS